MSALTLTCDALSCVRGDRHLFDGLSFTLGAGEALVLRGPNGSGKTSLLRLIAGLLKPAAGTVRIGGETPRDAAHLMHFAGHKDGLKAQLTVREQLRFWQQLFEGAGDIDAALSGWGLARVADLPCGVLSAGQGRRLALARLTVAKRGLWLLDEPTAPLDTRSIEAFEAAVAKHRAGGGIVVIAAHRPLNLDDALVIDFANRAEGAVA